MNSTPVISPEALLEDILPLAQAGQWEALREQYHQRIQISGEETAATLYVLALAAYAQNELAEAAALATRAVAGADAFAECADLIAIAHGLAGDINTALYYAKFAVTLPAREDLKALQPAYYPDFAQVLKTVEQDKLVNRAKVAIGRGDLALAENFLRQHLYFFPDDEDAMLMVAMCRSVQADHGGACDWLRGTVHRRSKSADLVSALATELANAGAFDQARAVHQRATALAPDDAVIAARQIHDLDDAPLIAPAEVQTLAVAWGERFATTSREASAAPDGLPAPLNVGLLLCELPGTSSGDFFAQILSRANPKEFRLVGYGYGTLADPGNIEFQHTVSEWYDLTGMDAETIADMLCAESPDLIVDTAGFLSPLSLAALGGRCAPRQVLWRNTPYGTGMAAIDGHFTDAVLEACPGPKPASRPIELKFGTVLASLPSAELPYYDTAERTQLTFGADVSRRQLTAETAAWWAEVLLAAPNSMLVLRGNGLKDPKAVQHLTDLFGNFGVAHRIDLISAANGAEFWSEVDVALLPPRAVQPQRAVDTLWGGLPVLAPQLPGRGTSTIASLFSHAGLGELVAASPADFALQAKHWADAGRRQSFRNTIRDRLAASPVFDPEARAQDLWQACRQLFQ